MTTPDDPDRPRPLDYRTPPPKSQSASPRLASAGGWFGAFVISLIVYGIGQLFRAFGPGRSDASPFDVILFSIAGLAGVILALLHLAGRRNPSEETSDADHRFVRGLLCGLFVFGLVGGWSLSSR